MNQKLELTRKIAVFLGVLFILSLPVIALAAGQQFLNIPALEPLWGATLTGVLKSVANVVFAILGLIAVAYIIYGGVLYITAGGDAEKAGKGRTAITNAIIGIVIILLSFAIYQYIRTLGGGVVPGGN